MKVEDPAAWPSLEFGPLFRVETGRSETGTRNTRQSAEKGLLRLKGIFKIGTTRLWPREE